ncbi:MAG: hypothetical protein M3R38_16610 [Actinomycetota bacterium]|nr:hypothetical protein [Actinomycetota bacterium]
MTDLQANGVGVLVVVSVNEVAIVSVQPGVDGALLQRRNVYDHGRVGCPLPGVGPEDGVVVILPGKTQLALPYLDVAIIFVGGTRAEDRVVVPGVSLEAVVEPDEVLRQEVERPKLFAYPEREVRRLERCLYRARRSRQYARPRGGADTRRAQELQEIAATVEPRQDLLLGRLVRTLLHACYAPLQDGVLAWG